MTLRSRETGTTTSRVLDADHIAALRKLFVDAGAYDLDIKLDGHRRASRNIDARNGESLALGRIGVARAPVIRGLVHPPSAAKLTWGTSRSASADASGHFAIAIDEEWPRQILVSAPGFGTKVVAIPATEADVDLSIELTKGGSVRVRVKRKGIDDPLEVLLGVQRDELEPVWIASKRIGSEESAAVFNDVERGVYVVLVRGRDPLEQLTAKVVLGTGDTRSVDLQPSFAFVTGRLLLGGTPLANASVMLTHHDSNWRARVTSDENGVVRSALWEQGKFLYQVALEHGRAPHSGTLRLESDGLQKAIAFSIDVPNRSVRGRAVDAHGDGVIAGVTLRSRRPDGNATTVKTITDASGAFEFNGVPAGEQTLFVNPRGMLRPDAIVFTMADDDSLHEQNIVLKSGYERLLRLRTSADVAVSNATVLCVANGVVRSQTITDSEGRATIATPEEGPSVLYVVPREGSLLVQRLGAAIEDDGGVMRLVVPSGNASLTISARGLDGVQIPGVSLLLRYNGELIPLEVAEILAREQGLALTTNESGDATLAHIPTGLYELWPYRTDVEAQSLIASATVGLAPIVVNVVTGQNDAVVRFRRRR